MQEARQAARTTATYARPVHCEVHLRCPLKMKGHLQISPDQPMRRAQRDGDDDDPGLMIASGIPVSQPTAHEPLPRRGCCAATNRAVFGKLASQVADVGEGPLGGPKAPPQVITRIRALGGGLTWRGWPVRAWTSRRRSGQSFGSVHDDDVARLKCARLNRVSFYRRGWSSCWICGRTRIS